MEKELTPLRKARLEKDMSVLDLSQRSGIKRSRLDHLELGKTKIKGEEAAILNKILETDTIKAQRP